MWRSVFAVILLPALTAAEAAQINPQPGTTDSTNGPQTQADCPTPRRAKPYSSSYTKYNGIRRGREGEAAIQLVGYGFVTTPKSPASGVVPLQLELQPAEGLMVRKIDYPKANTKSQFHAEPIPVVGSPAIRLKVRIDRNAALGIHVLKGRLTFQPLLPNTGAGPVQHMDVEIPINVVEHDAVLKRSQWPFYQTPVALIVVLIVLSPVLVAAVIPIMAACAITTGAAFCND